MFIANNQNDERIDIESIVEDDEYFCQVCGAPVIIKAKESSVVKKHFAHKRGINCIDSWNHDMSEWHFSWQSFFPKECREIVLEKDNVRHRADICIGDTIIEFQHSPISATEIAERNKFYMECGYKVVWLFDARDKIKNWLDESIDPLKCRSDDLCWKRVRSCFSKPMHPDVKVFLQYTTTVSAVGWEGQKFDIIVKLNKLSDKDLVFEKTDPYYITQYNFLKEFGAYSDERCFSISDITKHSKEIYSERKRR